MRHCIGHCAMNIGSLKKLRCTQYSLDIVLTGSAIKKRGWKNCIKALITRPEIHSCPSDSSEGGPSSSRWPECVPVILTNALFVNQTTPNEGSIPTKIGRLSKLTSLCLSYNSFGGSETNFANLQNLQLVHLHGNRLSGTIPKLNFEFVKQNRSSYIADCGKY